MGVIPLIKDTAKKIVVKEPKEPKEAKKLKKRKKPKKRRMQKTVWEKMLLGCLHFFLSFFLGRTSLFFGIAPFGGSIFLATGGGLSAYAGAMLGSYTLGGYPTMIALSFCFVLKQFLKKERWDVFLLLICFAGVFAAAISEFITARRLFCSGKVWPNSLNTDNLSSTRLMLFVSISSPLFLVSFFLATKPATKASSAGSSQSSPSAAIHSQKGAEVKLTL